LLAGSGSKLVGLFGSVFSSTTAAVEEEATLAEAVAVVAVVLAVLALAEVFAGAGACGRLFCGLVIVCDFIFSSILSSSSTRGSNVLCFIP